MSYLNNYQQVNNPFFVSGKQSGYPFKDYFRAQPQHENSLLVDPREAGYRPYKQYNVLRQIEPFINDCAVYQYSCDLILPSNKCYKKNGNIVLQP